jgi:hypothetical protein
MDKMWTAILAACAVSSAAIAVDQPGTGRPHWDPAAMQQRHAQREARRADEVALLLGLRPDQHPSLDRYLQAVRPSHGGPGDMPNGAAHKPMADDTPLPARLDAMEASINRHDTMAKQRIAATRAFYAALTLDQQRCFDALEDLGVDRMHRAPDGRGGPGEFRRAGGFGGDRPPAPPVGD